MDGATRFALLIVLSVLVAVEGHDRALGADVTEAGIKAHLTGGDERAWVKTRWVPVLSEPAQCAQGELWIFDQNGKWIKKTCENGLARERELDWAWGGVQDDWPVLIVGENTYAIELRQKRSELEGEPPVLVTILRGLRTSQTEPVEEITLEFWER